jgi:hypothetical protein
MLRILELAWLGIALVSACITVYQFINDGSESAVWMLFVTVVSGIMYSIRHRQRVRYEAGQQSPPDEESRYH